MNFTKGRNALRAKFDYIGEEDITPIDLVIFSYSNPRLEKVTSIVIDINGKEFNKNIPFTVKLSINIIRKKFHLSGCVSNILTSFPQVSVVYFPILYLNNIYLNTLNMRMWPLSPTFTTITYNSYKHIFQYRYHIHT